MFDIIVGFCLQSILCVLFTPLSNLINTKACNFYYFKPSCGRINNRHEGKSDCLQDYSATCLLLSCLILICAYQFYINRVPWFCIWNYPECQMPTEYFSPFEKISYIVCINWNISLHDKDFLVEKLMIFFSIPPPGWFRYQWFQSRTHSHRINGTYITISYKINFIFPIIACSNFTSDTTYMR